MSFAKQAPDYRVIPELLLLHVSRECFRRLRCELSKEIDEKTQPVCEIAGAETQIARWGLFERERERL